MRDVQFAAKSLQRLGIDAKWYQAWSKNFPSRPMNPEELAAALRRNERWVRDKISNGYDFFDIGIDPARSTRSPFYEMEKRVLDEMGVKTIDIGR